MSGKPLIGDDGPEPTSADPAGPLAALLSTLSPASQSEIERQLRASLQPAESARERRVRTLLPLAEMLRGVDAAPGWSFPTIQQTDYEAQRPEGAPSGDWLAEKFDGWLFACRAAHSLTADGDWSATSNPWPNPSRGERRSDPYTRDEIIRSTRQCARELRLTPTSSTYERWVIRKRADARARGQSARLPRVKQIHRHFPPEEGGWAAALLEALGRKRAI